MWFLQFCFRIQCWCLEELLKRNVEASLELNSNWDLWACVCVCAHKSTMKCTPHPRWRAHVFVVTLYVFKQVAVVRGFWGWGGLASWPPQGCETQKVSPCPGVSAMEVGRPCQAWLTFRDSFIHVSLLGTTASPFLGNWNILIQRQKPVTSHCRRSSWQLTAVWPEFALGHVKEQHLRDGTLFSWRAGLGWPSGILPSLLHRSAEGCVIKQLFCGLHLSGLAEISSPWGYQWPVVEQSYT